MSRRSLKRASLIDEYGYEIPGLDRELRRVSKDGWKLKEARRERKRGNNRSRGKRSR